MRARHGVKALPDHGGAEYENPTSPRSHWSDPTESAGDRPHTLTLRLRGESGQILASVADTGTGMTSEVKERAGQFFYSTKPEGKGTGLGLAVVQHIVLRQRGTVAIDSKEGIGTTVTVKLPAASA